MTFKAVFRSLREVFPQVDLRILKAVAIEHSKDADAAVEFVLSEVIPSLSDPIKPHYTLDDTQEVRMQQDAILGHQGVEKENASLLPGPSAAGESDTFDDHTWEAHLRIQSMVEVSKDSNVEADEPHLSLSHQDAEEVNASLSSELMSIETDALHFTSHASNETVGDTTLPNGNSYDQLVSIVKPKEEVTSVERVAQPSLESSENGFVQNLCMPEASGTITVCCAISPIPEEIPSLKGFGAVIEKDVNHCVSKSEEHLPADSLKAATTSSQDILLAVSENVPDLDKHGPLSEKANDSLSGEYNDNHSRSITENGNGLASETDIASVVDDNNKPTAVATQSGHDIRINFLEDFITDVKANKKTLVSALDSVSNMMKEVELHEEKAKQAKQAASEAGLDILTKAENLQQKLKNEKEANDMRAGEVYGEKAILAAEARELQSRLQSLSDERDKSLSIIEQIRSTLEARLAAVAEERLAAEQEKLSKEESANKVLMEQEFIMDNIVQESKRLQQQSEENAKLREFLMDRGHIVDILQGEITVICEDVMLLKGRVDGGVPLHKMMPSTTCSLASSSSSSHNSSISSKRIVHPVELGESSKIVSEELPRSQELHSTANNKASKALSDDDWEFFDDEDYKLEMFG